MNASIVLLILIGIGVGAIYAKSRKPASQDPRENIYEDMRAHVLGLKLSDVGLKGDGQSLIACLMEIGYPENGAATLVMYADGAVSLYLSSGGGIIGAGEHENIRRVAKTYLDKTPNYVALMNKVEKYPKPKDGETYFYVVKENGVFLHKDVESRLGEGKSGFSEWFYDGQNVLTQLRLWEEKNGEK
jgi:hypothetical protein